LLTGGVLGVTSILGVFEEAASVVFIAVIFIAGAL